MQLLFHSSRISSAHSRQLSHGSAYLQAEFLNLFFTGYFLDLRSEPLELLIQVLIPALNVIDIIHDGDTSAARPAMTSAAPARRSGALTRAPVKRSTPLMTATFPSP